MAKSLDKACPEHVEGLSPNGSNANGQSRLISHFKGLVACALVRKFLRAGAYQCAHTRRLCA
jgi:hypothetical protein